MSEMITFIIFRQNENRVEVKTEKIYSNSVFLANGNFLIISDLSFS